MKDKDKPYIYFIQCNSFVKIGVSWTPDNRMDDLQTYNPYELRIMGVIKNGGYKTETLIHNRFSEDRVRGEWYHLNETLIEYIKQNTTKWKFRIYEVK